MFSREKVPFFKAVAVGAKANLASALPSTATAILLDAHAPGVYGGTGRTIDWNAAAHLVAEQSSPPVILAGGITQENAAEALSTSRACALDIASGAESTPGIKDFSKISGLLNALRSSPR